MSPRWGILALLFSVRAIMAFQFQAVAALSPVMMDVFSVGLAETGLMIGLYLAPGLLLSLPGGVLAQRFGDKEMVTSGLALMTLGGVMMAAGDTWSTHLAGRFLAGAGGVLLNVLMTKMVVDWFQGREVATAMAVFVNSWPVGIAAALLVLPVFARGGGYDGAIWLVAGLVFLALVLFPLGYRRREAHSPTTERGWPAGPVMAGVVAAGLVWGLYNAAVAMVFGFGTALLTEHGQSVADAGAATSLVLWMMAISIPIGGVIADRTGRNGIVMLIGFLGFAAALWLVRAGHTNSIIFIAMGLFAGVPAGPVMALPGRLLHSAVAATGMGIFFSFYYGLMLVLPWAVGWAADHAGTAAFAFDAGIGLLALTALSFLFYCRAARAALAQIPERQT